MTKRTCTIPDCEKPHAAKGYCNMHYTRLQRGQDLHAPQIRVRRYRGQKCKAPGCNSAVAAKNLCKPHYATFKRHGDFDRRNLPAETTLEDRLKYALPNRQPRQCWEWQRGRNESDYGVVSMTDDSGARLAHRAAYETWVGEIPPNTHVLHTCDNPPCCNPQHLFLGDDLTNSDDKISKKRHHNGERTGGHKLTDQQVVEIRDRYTGKRGQQTRLAEEFGITQGQVSMIVRGLSRATPTNWEAVAQDERLQVNYPERQWAK